VKAPPGFITGLQLIDQMIAAGKHVLVTSDPRMNSVMALTERGCRDLQRLLRAKGLPRAVCRNLGRKERGYFIGSAVFFGQPESVRMMYEEAGLPAAHVEILAVDSPLDIVPA
jgi:hypothetical protein